MQSTFKRALCLLLALGLLVGLLPAYSLPVKAAGDGVAINAENFPDAHFRSYVHNFDTDSDGALSETEIAEATQLYCGELEISTLKGIEFFTAMRWLDCGGNQLTALDLSKNTALIDLSCYGNQLTALDLSKNTALEVLDCRYNQLTALDLSKNTALEELNCSGNQLTAIDLSKNTALIDLSCDDNQLTALDLSKNPALTHLYCYDNQLTALDLSKNTALTDLSCYGNQLTALDLSTNTALTELYCYDNQLTALDLSRIAALTYLDCDSNQLTALDLSKNTALTTLYCSSNQLTVLDLSKNTALTDLSCYSNQLTALDLSTNTALTDLSCGDNQLTALDLSTNTALEGLNCGWNYLTALDLSKTPALTWLDCDWNQLTALDLSKNTALEELNCSYNQLTALDLSKNTALRCLYCQNNQIQTLDISKNPVLEYTLLNGLRDSDAQDYCLYWCDDEFYSIFGFDRFTSVLLSDGTVFQELPFADISPEDYFFQPVLWAVEKGITSGTDNIHFSPDMVCTREQVVTFLWAAFGREEPASLENPFTDVPDDAWYLKPVLWAAERGITSGVGNGQFGVGQSCTRSQVVTFLWAAAKRPEPTSTENPFTDVPDDAWYLKPVLWAVEHGVTSGTGEGLFSPDMVCTRAQVVTFLYAALEKNK